MRNSRQRSLFIKCLTLLDNVSKSKCNELILSLWIITYQKDRQPNKAVCPFTDNDDYIIVLGRLERFASIRDKTCSFSLLDKLV